MNNGPVQEWTFEELKTYCAWMVMKGILSGSKLKDEVEQVIYLTMSWLAEQERKK